LGDDLLFHRHPGRAAAREPGFPLDNPASRGQNLMPDIHREWGEQDADLDRAEHEQGPAVVFWSGDYGAELERLEFDQETQSERGRSEPPERGIEDDEELER
jgi:hypothetical protein